MFYYGGAPVSAQDHSNSHMQRSMHNESFSNDVFTDPEALQSYYMDRNYAPVWIGGEGQLDRARSVWNILAESWTHGLNPAHYHVNELAALFQGGMYDSKGNHLEYLMSDAVMRYVRDMTGMRINPADINQREEYWRTPLTGKAALSRVADSDTPTAALQDLAPRDPLYGLLRKELIRLGGGEESHDHLLPIRFSNYLLRPGHQDRNIPTLRARLGVIHNPNYGPETIYDDNLAAAVMQFQKEHGLDADGVVGPKTLAILNRSNRDKMRQIVSNLERLRWMEQDRPSRYVVVNVPSQMLWAIENDQIALEMPVVVGMPSRQTKSFKTEITGMRFNPTWTVPLSIKMRDMLPRLQEDPTYISQKGIQLYYGVGNERVTLDPTAINWHEVTRSDMNAMRMVQVPGDHNALGRIRVLMPNRYDIYLHDTNQPELFSRQDRTFSSGCIRMADPVAMARFIMQGRPGWTDEDMNRALESGRMTDVSVNQTLPVYIIHMTAWADEAGRIVYGPDVYGHDERLVGLLEKMQAFALPEPGPTANSYAHASSEMEATASAY